MWKFDLFSWKKRAREDAADLRSACEARGIAVGVADADLDMAFLENAGSFEDGTSFGEDAAHGVENFIFLHTGKAQIIFSFQEHICMHTLDYSTI